MPLEGVIVTIQPGTGYVKALVGGRNYSKTQFNRAIQAKRQPGSLFKPFVYIAAMDPAREHNALTAASVLLPAFDRRVDGTPHRQARQDADERGIPQRDVIDVTSGFNFPRTKTALV